MSIRATLLGPTYLWMYGVQGGGGVAARRSRTTWFAAAGDKSFALLADARRESLGG
jgi:hypothetical protein